MRHHTYAFKYTTGYCTYYTLLENRVLGEQSENKAKSEIIFHTRTTADHNCSTPQAVLLETSPCRQLGGQTGAVGEISEYFKFRALCAIPSSSCRGLGGPSGPLLHPHPLHPSLLLPRHLGGLWPPSF